MFCCRYPKLINRQTKLFLHLSPYRTSMNYPPQRFREVEERWQKLDSVPKQWELIYSGPMEVGTKYISTFLSCIIPLVGCSGIYYYLNEKKNTQDPVLLGEVLLANNSHEALVFSIAFVIFHLSLKILLSRYVLRLYKHDDNYLAVYRGHFFNSVVKHQFNIDQFKKMKPNLILPWSHSKYSFGKKQGILLEYCFKTPEYLNNLINQKKDTK